MSPSADLPAAWRRLGEQLTRRRVELDPRYQNRQVFCDERGVDYRLIYDIEEARRTNFRKTTLAAIAAAYAVTPESLDDTLRGGDLRRVPRPSVSAPPPVSSPDSPDAMDELRPEAEWDDAWRLYPHPDDRAKRDIIRLTHLTLHQRAILVEDLDHGRAHPEKDKTVSREGTGLPCRDPSAMVAK